MLESHGYFEIHCGRCNLGGPASALQKEQSIIWKTDIYHIIVRFEHRSYQLLLLRSNQNLCLSCRTLAGQANIDVHGIGSSITCRSGFFYTCKHTSQRASFFRTGAGKATSNGTSTLARFQHKTAVDMSKM
ncbi:hypothetical protein Peur_035819 [Populus x canadensis]